MSGCKYQAADGSVCGKNTKPGSPWCWGHAITIDNQIAASAARLAAEAAAKAETAKMRDLDADLHARVRREAVWEADHGAGAAQPAQGGSDPPFAATKARLDAAAQSVTEMVASINAQHAAPVLDPEAVAMPNYGVDGNGRAFIVHPAIPYTTRGAVVHGLKGILVASAIGLIPSLFVCSFGAMHWSRDNPTSPAFVYLMLLAWAVCIAIGFGVGYLRYGGHPQRIEYPRTPMEEIAQDFVHAYRQRTWFQRGRGW